MTRKSLWTANVIIIDNLYNHLCRPDSFKYFIGGAGDIFSFQNCHIFGNSTSYFECNYFLSRKFFSTIFHNSDHLSHPNLKENVSGKKNFFEIFLILKSVFSVQTVQNQSEAIFQESHFKER